MLSQEPRGGPPPFFLCCFPSAWRLCLYKLYRQKYVDTRAFHSRVIAEHLVPKPWTLIAAIIADALLGNLSSRFKSPTAGICFNSATRAFKLIYTCALRSYRVATQHICTELLQLKRPCWKMAATEIPRGDWKNGDWSAWASCVSDAVNWICVRLNGVLRVYVPLLHLGKAKDTFPLRWKVKTI